MPSLPWLRERLGLVVSLQCTWHGLPSLPHSSSWVSWNLSYINSLHSSP